MSQSLKTIDETPVQSFGDGILAVIARAAADPNVDIDKMERLLEMQERVLSRGAKAEYFAALSEMQPNLPVIGERGAISTDKGRTVQSTYALWEDVNEAIRPILSEYGFALSFKVRRADGEIVTTAVLSHRMGHSEETELALPTDTSGSKNAVQAVGSSTSYGKRYTAFALLNLTSAGEDDDGEKGGRAPSVSKVQFDTLDGLADAVGADKRKFCRLFQVDGLRDIPATRYDEALRLMRDKNPGDADAFLFVGAGK